MEGVAPLEMIRVKINPYMPQVLGGTKSLSGQDGWPEALIIPIIPTQSIHLNVTTDPTYTAKVQ